MRLRRRTPGESWHDLQAGSRKNLATAVRNYTALRLAAGPYDTTVAATLRDGTPVVVIVSLEIVPDPMTGPAR